MWYTDSSKTTTGTGAGVYGKTHRCNMRIPLGQHATVFQAEIHAINMCVNENLRRGYSGMNITILTDSQASIKALTAYEVRSKLVWNCLQNLNTLANHNKVKLVWVPGHKGIDGNERADSLARQGSSTTYICPEPALAITKATINGCIAEWVQKEHISGWDRLPGLDHSKRMLRTARNSLTADILKLNRSQIRQITGLLTGHCSLRGHLRKLGIYKEDPICRLCYEEEETVSHIILECEALTRWRMGLQGQHEPKGTTAKNLINGLLELIRKTNLLT